MAYLNIPMHKSHTARHHRRAVWLYGVALFFWLAGLWFVSALWLTRDALSAHAPDGTVAIIHLSPTNGAWKNLIADFGHIPLISDRYLTLSDLRPYTQGELSIYVMEDGTRAIGIRSSERDLPTKTLDTYGISFQKVGNGLYILSEKPLPVPTKAKTSFSLARLFPGVIGTVRVTDGEDDSEGTIRQTGAGYAISGKKIDAPSLRLETLPENTIAALSMPALPITQVENVTGQIDALLAPLELGTAEQVRTAIEGRGATMILAAKENGSDILLRFPKPESLDLSAWMKAVSALKQAKIQKITLPDNTTAEEIVIDPSAVVIEEVQMAGLPVLRTESVDGPLLMTEKDDFAFVSTSEDLLNGFLSPSGERLHSCAASPAVLFQPKVAEAFLLNGANAYQSTPINSLSGSFSQIALSNGLFSQKIVLCR